MSWRTILKQYETIYDGRGYSFDNLLRSGAVEKLVRERFDEFADDTRYEKKGIIEVDYGDFQGKGIQSREINEKDMDKFMKEVKRQFRLLVRMDMMYSDLLGNNVKFKIMNL